MNRHDYAFALATAGLVMMLAGIGINTGHAVDSKPIATGDADPVGSRVKLNTPFSQTLTCYAGVKPYFDRVLSGQWTVSYDGDQLTVTGGGQVNSGRFSVSGNPIERSNDAMSATLRTQTGSGGGRIWFERNLMGEVLSAGIIHRTGADRIECGNQYATQWIDQETPKVFGRDGEDLVWQSVPNIALNCVRYTGSDFTIAGIEVPQTGQLALIQNGAMNLTLNGEQQAAVKLSQPDQADRTASFVHETVRDGGQRIWISRHNSDGETDALRLRFRFNYNLLDIEYQQAGNLNTRCVPAPLDPRRHVES